MSASKKEGSGPGSATEAKSLENFVNAYLNAYREYISGKDMDEIHTPQFFKGFPYVSDIFTLSNGAVCSLFKKSSRSKFSASEGDFDTIMSRLRNQELDFMVVFPPFTNFNDDEAKRLARMDADRDLKSSRRLEMLTAAEAHLSEIHTDIQSVADLNPWLDQTAAEQRKKLDRAKELIMELYSEVEISREERFSDYMRQLSEVMAFEKGEIEEVTGEMAVQIETAIEEMDTRLSDIEESIETIRNESGKGATSQAELSDLSRAVKGIGQNIDKLQSSFKDITQKFADIEEQFEANTAENSEMKETVMRDSKRTYNLNERITDLERSIGNMKNDAGKDSQAAVKALEGRLNVMEKEIRDISRNVSRLEPRDSQPVVIESPVVETIEKTPQGTVKKTVKKTTTKKTTRSK